MDVPHLTYAMPVFYVLLGWAGSRLKTGKLVMAGVMSISLLATIFLWYGISARSGQTVLETRVGKIRASGDDVTLIRKMTADIPSGERFFSFPYFPLSYF